MKVSKPQRTSRFSFFQNDRPKKAPVTKLRWADDEDHPGVPNSRAKPNRWDAAYAAPQLELGQANSHHKDWFRPLVSTAVLIAVLGFGAAGVKTYMVVTGSDGPAALMAEADLPAEAAELGVAPASAAPVIEESVATAATAPLTPEPELADRFDMSFEIAASADRPAPAALVSQAQSLTASQQTASASAGPTFEWVAKSMIDPAQQPAEIAEAPKTPAETETAAAVETGTSDSSALGYSSDQGGSNDAQTAIAAAAPEKPVDAGETASIAAAVNMRSEASNRGSVLAVLPAGAQVGLQGCDSWWCTVTYDGQTGYVSRRFVNRAS